MQDPIFKGNKVPNPETGYPGDASAQIHLPHSVRCSLSLQAIGTGVSRQVLMTACVRRRHL